MTVDMTDTPTSRVTETLTLQASPILMVIQRLVDDVDTEEE
jgi:hypothetical protein